MNWGRKLDTGLADLTVFAIPAAEVPLAEIIRLAHRTDPPRHCPKVQ